MRTRILATILSLLSTVAMADEIVRVSGALAVLNKPSAPRASLILVPGGLGDLRLTEAGGMDKNQEVTTLPRNRKAFSSMGVATLLIDNSVSIGEAALYMTAIAQPVVVVALSRGSTRINEIVAARPSGIVLVSALLGYVQSRANAASLPPTLIIHHRQDACPETLPNLVEPFQRWAGAKVRVAWIEGGENKGSACFGLGHHGLAGRDDVFRAAVTNFAVGLGLANPVATTIRGNSMEKGVGSPVSSKGPKPKTDHPAKSCKRFC